MLKYSAKYFDKTKQIMEKHKPDSIVVLQFFQRQDNTLIAGIDEVLELLKNNTDTSKYTIRAIKEGTIVDAFAIVLELEGPYQYFGEYEGIIDGILARATSLPASIAARTGRRDAAPTIAQRTKSTSGLETNSVIPSSLCFPVCIVVNKH